MNREQIILKDLEPEGLPVKKRQRPAERDDTNFSGGEHHLTESRKPRLNFESDVEPRWGLK